MAQSPSLTHVSTSPVFNTKAVVRETGVPADTFRAWERRYGVPRPQRTTGGHRLYSERDIAIIRWLHNRTEDGVNISHAVMLLNNVLDAPTAEAVGNGEPRAMTLLVGELVRAFVGFNLQRAESVISEAFAIYPCEDVLIELIQAAMIEVGDSWHRGEASVAVEHFATQFVRRKLGGMIGLFGGNGRRGPIVVGCAPSELHDLGAMMSSLFLMRRGWDVVYLGPQLPLADLIEAARSVKPLLVCLSATTTETASELIAIGRSLKESCPDILFGYGGRIFNINPELRVSMPGTFLGHDARETVETVNTLVGRSSMSLAD